MESPGCCPNSELNGITTGLQLKHIYANRLGLSPNEFYLTTNGKLLRDEDIIGEQNVHCFLKVLGGKGGFGSMLRAIGAQIEKTTNREACRDLSGRRLRDINEEKRLKSWISQQAEREKEAKERKQKKLEKLCEEPKHNFKDEVYDKERSELPEKVENAVLKGIEASSSSTKRKSENIVGVVKKKKPKIWVDDDLELSASDDDDGSEPDYETEPQPQKSPSTITSKDDCCMQGEPQSDENKTNKTSLQNVFEDDSKRKKEAQQ